MTEKIRLDENTYIYKCKIKLSDVDQLISDIKLNLDVSIDAKKSTAAEPGIQSTIVISTPLIKEFTEKIIDVIFKIFDLDKNTPYITNQWSYISDKKNIYTGFHKHDTKRISNLTSKWTYTYYIQMPDNLIGDDGKLVFKLDDDSIHTILPEVGDLLIFPATLLHAPMTNTNSDLERIVLAGVWNDVSRSDVMRKKNKTLL
jgi:hypothetical protein